jgi:hypothetical protein
VSERLPSIAPGVVAGAGSASTVSAGELESLRSAFRGRAIEVLVRSRPVTDDAATMADTIGELGLETLLTPQSEFEPAPSRVVLARGTIACFPAAFKRLRAARASERPYTILWLTEALPLPGAAGLRLERLHARELAKIVLGDDRVADPRSNARSLIRACSDGLLQLPVISMKSGQLFLSERGIAAEHVPIGCQDDWGRDLGLERDIDVLFLGDLRVRRRKRIVRRLRREGISVLALGGWGDRRYWGEERTELLNRVKIMLNIPRHPGLLSGARMLLGMANKALVVAEPVYFPEPYVPGRHYVNAPLEEMVGAVRAYLEDEQARREIIETAYDFARQQLTIERSLARILRLASERSAS